MRRLISYFNVCKLISYQMIPSRELIVPFLDAGGTSKSSLQLIREDLESAPDLRKHLCEVTHLMV